MRGRGWRRFLCIESRQGRINSVQLYSKKKKGVTSAYSFKENLNTVRSRLTPVSTIERAEPLADSPTAITGEASRSSRGSAAHRMRAGSARRNSRAPNAASSDAPFQDHAGLLITAAALLPDARRWNILVWSMC